MGEGCMSKSGTIQLRRSFFPEIELVANPGYVPETDAQVSVNAAFRVGLQPENQEEGIWVVNVDIEVTWPEMELPPYSKARLIHVGVFEVNTDMPDEVLEKHLTISAPSMLYSGAREFLKVLTASGPYPAVMLPSTQFRHEPVLSKIAEEAEQAKSET
jgi:preprotein translocase subunit SecB